MELRRQTSKIIGRLFRKSFQNVPYRSAVGITGTLPKEEINTSLLNSFNRDIKEGGVVPVFRRALLFPNRVALQDEFGIYTYAGLYQAASMFSLDISAQINGQIDRTITYMCSNDASHVIVQWAIWMSGNIAVPLTPLHPPEMQKYFIIDTSACLIVCTQEYEKILRPISTELKKPILVTGRDKEVAAQLYQPNTSFLKPKPEDMLSDVGKSNEWYGKNDALIIYTSGTTSKPKGVVWTHNMLQVQIAALHSAWQYSCNDVVLHTLPLHHIHGQLNSMLASLAAGARIRMLSSFASHTVWARLLGMGERDEARVTVLHGVPAMYARLVRDHERMFYAARTHEYVRSSLAARMRLMTAGSAPLPASLFCKWEEISGIRLLERFGMSEVGMALSNPYRPVEARTVGCVGLPLPGVAVRIAAVDDDGNLEPLITVETPPTDARINLDRASQYPKIFGESEDWMPPRITTHKQQHDSIYTGELLVKGPSVFTRYWNKPASFTSTHFTEDGWFRTGDTAMYSDGKFRILGRTSIDIIKTSGYKVSAVQVESVILEHPFITDAAVIGVENEDYGEIVAAVIVLKEKTKLTLRELNDMAGKKLAPYQLLRNMLVIDEMPRNVMGKLDKKEIKRLYAVLLALPPKN